MVKDIYKTIDESFPVFMGLTGPETRNRILAECSGLSDIDALIDSIRIIVKESGLPGYLPELARLEYTYSLVNMSGNDIPSNVFNLSLNPTLNLLQNTWKNLTNFLDEDKSSAGGEIVKGQEFVLVWKNSVNSEVNVRAATEAELFVLKMIMEGYSPEYAARQGGLPVGAVDRAIDHAVENGLLLKPVSRITRWHPGLSMRESAGENRVSAEVFTLQWHITQDCDLHCRHCYDRAERPPLSIDSAIQVIDKLRSFCRNMHVKGQVIFTGGNPFLHPDLELIYKETVERGLGVAILANPVPRQRLEKLIEIQMPSFFQVSLEGLEEHNDIIRGRGNYSRVMRFLGLLKELGVYSMVMLTLTKDNADQVLQLAEVLREKTDQFNFNRLSAVGEGADLLLPSQSEFHGFLERYLDARTGNPAMAIKDNLFNIILDRKGDKLFGGCTGFGCGAAFNFMAVLPDGQAHACRKFPSPIGNVYLQSIDDVYYSKRARQYRQGPAACKGCGIRSVCGGCLAVSHGFGYDIFKDKDPYCFRDA